MNDKEIFKIQLKEFANGLGEYISTDNGQWTIKGFIYASISPKTAGYSNIVKESFNSNGLIGVIR